MRITKREREVPPESTVWAAAGVSMLTVAVGVIVSSIALSGDGKANAGILWTIAAASTVLALTCFLAHWDVNRGRRVRQAEIEEETKLVR